MLNNKIFMQAIIPQRAHLQAYALRLTLNSENAKDLMQETFFKAYRFWDSFEQGTNVKAWLYRIMKNSYINSYRKERNEPIKITYEDYHLPLNTRQESALGQNYVRGKPYDEIFGDEITRSIDSMAAVFKNILILSDVEGLTYEEIAKVVKCPIGTVRSRLHRGRNQLKKKLVTYARNNRYISNNSD